VELRICHRRSVMPSCSSRPVSKIPDIPSWKIMLFRICEMLHWMFNCMWFVGDLCISWFTFRYCFSWFTEDVRMIWLRFLTCLANHP
jgi:hypothetical protein